MTARQGQLPGTELEPRLFGADDLDLLDQLAAQATDADYQATADLLKQARKREQR